jgi:integrase
MAGQPDTPVYTLGCGTDNRRPQGLSCAFATDATGNWVDVRRVQELLRHADLQTTARYLHADIRTKRAAVAKITGLVAAQSGPTENTLGQ